MKILFYRLTHSPWLLIFLLSCILQPLTLFQFSFPRGSIPIHTVSSHSQRKQGQVLSTLFSYDGGRQTFNYGQTVANQPNYLIMIPPNTKSILTSFDRFNHNYCSICVFLQPKSFCNFLLHNRRMCSANVKKDADPSKLLRDTENVYQAR